MAYKRKVPSSFRKCLNAELGFWQNENIINSDQAGKISDLYQLESLKKESVNTLLWIIYIIASSLIGIGVISFVSAHWGDISATVKVSMLVGSMLACHIVGFYLWQIDGRCKKLGHTLVFLGTLIFGASIGLIAQIFHIHSNPSNGFWAWAIGAIIMGYLLQSTPNIVIAIVTSFIGFVAGMDNIFWWGYYKPFDLYPIIAALIFLPYVYKNRSGFTFYLTMLAITISTIIISSWHDKGEFLGFNLAAIAAGLLLMGFGLILSKTERFRHFAGIYSLGALLLCLDIFILTFRNSVQEVKMLSFDEPLKSFLWALPALCCFLLGIIFYISYLAKHPKDKSIVIHIVLLAAALIQILGLFTKFFDDTNIAVIGITNVTFLIIAAVLIWQSFVLSERGCFWVGVIMITMIIVSRSLEYDTGLIFKSIAFLTCGVALMASGILFEKILKRRRLTND